VPQDSPERIEQPLGNGPYRARYQDDGIVRLTAFDRYWGPPPAEREALLTSFDSRSSPASSLIAGDVDVVVDVASEEVRRLRAAPGVRITSMRSPTVDILYMRVDSPPFSDIRVRRALDAALDRPALVQTLLAGLGQPAAQFVSSSTFGFDPDGTPRARDLPAARRLLAEAGYPSGFDAVLELRDDQQAEPIVAQLAEARVRVTLKPARADALLTRLASGEAKFVYVRLLSDSGDASDTFESALHSRAAGFGASNYAGYANPALDALIETTAGTRQPGERRRLLQECMRLSTTDLPMIPLFERDWTFAFREEVRWEPRADGRLLASDLHRVRRGS
jgi:peptide/nickel transport system substrate-binding protein